MTQAAQLIESSISPSSAEIEVVQVPSGFSTPWADEQIRKHLEPAIALSHGRITIDQVFHLLHTERAQVWFAMEHEECVTVVVTEIIEWVSGRRCLKVILAGGYGSMHKTLAPIMETLESFALQEVCASVLVEGRRGWERALPEEYTFSHISMEKELF
jgi:cobalamin biosynthesis protein CbiD